MKRDVGDIVRWALIVNGHDGLHEDGECACLRDDLAPCGCLSTTCRPGYRRDYAADEDCGLDCSGTEHWHIQEEKP